LAAEIQSLINHQSQSKRPAARGGEAESSGNSYPSHFAITVKDSLGHCKPRLTAHLGVMRDSKKAVTSQQISAIALCNHRDTG
jgi:hypothetical protein